MHGKGQFVFVDECVLIYCAKILRVLFLNFLIVLFLAIQLTPILCCAMYFLLVSVRLALINGSGCASRPMLASPGQLVWGTLLMEKVFSCFTPFSPDLKFLHLK